MNAYDFSCVNWWISFDDLIFSMSKSDFYAIKRKWFCDWTWITALNLQSIAFDRIDITLLMEMAFVVLIFKYLYFDIAVFKFNLSSFCLIFFFKWYYMFNFTNFFFSHKNEIGVFVKSWHLYPLFYLKNSH